MSDTCPLLPIGPLLPTALTLVHFYLQVWHLPIFTHRSDTSQAFATFTVEIFAVETPAPGTETLKPRLTAVHFYPLADTDPESEMSPFLGA